MYKIPNLNFLYYKFIFRYVIPIGLLKLLSWKELETLVCGKPILDIELLKENTVYRVILFKNNLF